MKKAQIKKWKANTLEFLYPALVVAALAFLGHISGVLETSESIYATILLYLVNVAKDYLKKRGK